MYTVYDHGKLHGVELIVCLCNSLGSVKSMPSKLLRVCAGSDRSDEGQRGGRFNISWDPLPCHLQNGADITDYIIQYSPTSGREVHNITTTAGSSVLTCGRESGGPYRCLIAGRFFNRFKTYTFQVAARNSNGVGSFSDPVNTTQNSQGMILI